MTEGSWAGQALASCLETLKADSALSWQPTIAVIDSWLDGDDAFCVVYRHPGFPHLLGLRRTARDRDGWQDSTNAVTYGARTARDDVMEPIGDRASSLRTDQDGVQWWGRIASEPPVHPS